VWSAYSINFTKDIDELLGKANDLGLEGLIGKRGGSRYEAGKRTGAWVKIKLYQKQEFVIGGYTEPEGSRKHFGGWNRFHRKLLKLLSGGLNKIAVKDCPFYNLPTTGRGLDPGLTAAEMKRCVWVKPIVVCKVKFTEWTRDDRLRHPVFLGLRDDKKASEVVREKSN
jgi:bifunctional non-homologous end joining protein LigD